MRKHLFCGFRSSKIVLAMAADKKSFLIIDSITTWGSIDCFAVIVRLHAAHVSIVS